MPRNGCSPLLATAILSALCVHNFILAEASDPIVTLSHGGQLRGLQTTFQSKAVDLFLGVRYAKPPIGELRFQKPKSVSWTGVEDATSVGNICLQVSPFVPGELTGSEDCLLLNIAVPGGVQVGAKKPVMVWIHGGGYIAGASTGYIGGPLAIFGDVIVVSLNYRLGLFGFLFDGPGTGNYGLWDQRAALLWVKENIEQFGGDPDLVTIFGESAGAGSVAAQAMSQHSDGLFKRVIQESGSLYQLWGWNMYESKNNEKVHDSLRRGYCKDSDLSTYQCIQHVPAEEILGSLPYLPLLYNPFNPMPDGDFFPSNITTYSYESNHRFDIMSGMNKQEGLIIYAFELMPFAMNFNKSVADGIDIQLLKEFLMQRCKEETPLSPSLCLEHIIDVYGFSKAADDRERLSLLVDFLGDHHFGVDIIHGLEEHASFKRSTYAYHFAEEISTKGGTLWPSPSWMKTKTDHGDELCFVFGITFVADDEPAIWKDMLAADPFFTTCKKEFAGLSEIMMKMWTNFAKSGNPNEPEKLPEGIPTWPQFNTETNQLLEINSKDMKVVTTPNKERLDRLRQVLYADRETQFQAAIAENERPKKPSYQPRDEL